MYILHTYETYVYVTKVHLLTDTIGTDIVAVSEG